MKIINKILASRDNKKVAQNVSWALIGKVVNIISSLFVGILVARYLGPEQYGLMNYVISYIAIFQIISSFGLENIEIRELSKEPNKRITILTTSFLLRLIFAFITIILVAVSLFVFKSDFQVKIFILIYSLSIIFNTLKVVRNYFTSIVLNKPIVKSEISRTILGMIIKIILLLLEVPLIFFIIAITFDFLIVSIGYLVSFNKEVGLKQNWNFNRKVAISLIKQAFPLLLSASAVIIYQKIDQVILKNLIHNQAVGYYSVASKILEFGIFLPVIFSQTVAPILVRMYHDDIQEYRRKVQFYMDLIFWGALFIGLITCFLAYYVIIILFGSDYQESISVLRILSFKIIFIALFNFSAQIIIIEGVQNLVVLRNLVACFFNIGLNFLLIPKWGINGAAISSALTFLISGFLAHFFIKKYRFIFRIQANSILFGWRRIYKFFKA